MSTPEDKAQARGTAGPARCKMEHLEAQFGYRVTEGHASRPERVEVTHPGYSARWRRVSPDTYEMDQ